MIFKITFGLFFTLSLFALLFQAVSATTIISPIIELEANPGETQAGVVKIFNELPETIFLTSSIESFTTGDEPGVPVYLPADKGGVHLSWFSLGQEELVLQSEQIAIIPFEVTVPIDAVPGGYYSVIFWGTASDPADGNAQVSIGGKVGTLVFLKVKGDLIEEGEIVDFQVKSGNMHFSFPINFSFQFSNLGNIHLAPTGSIELKNWFGQKQQIEVNSSGNNVLPDSTRFFETIWGQLGQSSFIGNFFNDIKLEFSNLAIGKHTATLNLDYGSENKQSVSSTVEFWIFPVRSLSLVFLGLLIMIILIRINIKVNRLKKTIEKNKNNVTK